MRAHMLDYVTGSESLEELLSEEEVAWLRDFPEGVSPHSPIKAVSVLLSLLQESTANEVYIMDISNVLKSYLDRVVTCESIRHTPIPMPYTRCVCERFCIIITRCIACCLVAVLLETCSWFVGFGRCVCWVCRCLFNVHTQQSASVISVAMC